MFRLWSWLLLLLSGSFLEYQYLNLMSPTQKLRWQPYHKKSFPQGPCVEQYSKGSCGSPDGHSRLGELVRWFELLNFLSRKGFCRHHHWRLSGRRGRGEEAGIERPKMIGWLCLIGDKNETSLFKSWQCPRQAPRDTQRMNPSKPPRLFLLLCKVWKVNLFSFPLWNMSCNYLSTILEPNWDRGALG